MNREYILNPDALRRILNEEQFRLPLSHNSALHAMARLHGFKNWNAASASDLNPDCLKRRAKVLRTQLGAHADANLLTKAALEAICIAVSSIELSDATEETHPSASIDFTAEEGELLSMLGAGASTAELRELLGTRALDFPLLRLSSKIGIHSDPQRDEFARSQGFVRPQHIERLVELRTKRKPVVSQPTGLSLATGVTLAEFTSLIAAQDDNRGHHMLWVDRRGMIHLDLLPRSVAPVQHEQEIDNQMQFRYETFDQGGGYMGRTAAKDTPWIANLLDSLKRHWKSGAAGYIETY